MPDESCFKLLCYTFAIDYTDFAVTVLLYWISFSTPYYVLSDSGFHIHWFYFQLPTFSKVIFLPRLSRIPLKGPTLKGHMHDRFMIHNHWCEFSLPQVFSTEKKLKISGVECQRGQIEPYQSWILNNQIEQLNPLNQVKQE